MPKGTCRLGTGLLQAQTHPRKHIPEINTLDTNFNETPSNNTDQAVETMDRALPSLPRQEDNLSAGPDGFTLLRLE